MFLLSAVPALHRGFSSTSPAAPKSFPSIQTSIYTRRTQESTTPNFISNSRVQFSRPWTPLPYFHPSIHPTSNFEVVSPVDDSPKLDSPPKLNSFLVRLTRHFSHSSNLVRMVHVKRCQNYGVRNISVFLYVCLCVLCIKWANYLRGLPLSTSTEISGFWTPLLLLCPHFTQPISTICPQNKAI